MKTRSSRRKMEGGVIRQIRLIIKFAPHALHSQSSSIAKHYSLLNSFRVLYFLLLFTEEVHDTPQLSHGRSGPRKIAPLGLDLVHADPVEDPNPI